MEAILTPGTGAGFGVCANSNGRSNFRSNCRLSWRSALKCSMSALKCSMSALKNSLSALNRSMSALNCSASHLNDGRSANGGMGAIIGDGGTGATGATGATGGVAGIDGCARTEPGSAMSATTAMETKRVYLTINLPMKL